MTIFIKNLTFIGKPVVVFWVTVFLMKLVFI